MSFFEQVKKSLLSKLSIGTNSGSMWVIGAYQHPSIYLTTNWLEKHNNNFTAFDPININSRTFFSEGSCDNISKESVIQRVIDVTK